MILDEAFEGLRSTSFQFAPSQPTIFASLEAAFASLGISAKAADTFDEAVSQALEQGVAPEAGPPTGDAPGELETVEAVTEALIEPTGIMPEAGEVTAGGSRDAANTFGDPQFGTPFDLNVFGPGPQERTAPPLPVEDTFLFLAGPQGRDAPPLPKDNSRSSSSRSRRRTTRRAPTRRTTRRAPTRRTTSSRAPRRRWRGRVIRTSSRAPRRRSG